MEPRLGLSIVVPAYNEEQRLGATLTAIVDFLEHGERGAGEKMAAEVLVVDDGSEDTTSEIAGRVLGALEHGIAGPHRVLRLGPANHGKGYAVRHGVLASHGEVVLFTDADLSTPIAEVRKLLDALAGGCDVAIASRAIAGARIGVRQSFGRERLGRMFNAAVRALALPGIRDSQCGFKCFEREAARAIFSQLTIDGFGFDVEALYVARKLGYRIQEVPVEWNDAANSRVRPFVDGPKMLVDVVTTLVRHHGLPRRRTPERP